MTLLRIIQSIVSDFLLNSEEFFKKEGTKKKRYIPSTALQSFHYRYRRRPQKKRKGKKLGCGFAKGRGRETLVLDAQTSTLLGSSPKRIFAKTPIHSLLFLDLRYNAQPPSRISHCEHGAALPRRPNAHQPSTPTLPETEERGGDKRNIR